MRTPRNVTAWFDAFNEAVVARDRLRLADALLALQRDRIDLLAVADAMLASLPRSERDAKRCADVLAEGLTPAKPCN